MTTTEVQVNQGPKVIDGPPATAVDLGADFLLNVRRVKQQIAAVHEVMRDAMRDGVHYGVIPGTEKKDPRTGKDISKPTLYQPGADILCMLFNLRPRFVVDRLVERDDFIALTVRCKLINRATKEVVAEGIGTSNSREAKYKSSTSTKTCPKCNAATIFASKRDGGWFCWRQRGGCGAQFEQDDPEITSQAEVVSSDGVWNFHNTIVKIANKRAKMTAVMTATCAGEVFDIDLDDESAPDAGARMAPAQWNLILGEQKRLGIPMPELIERYVVTMCGRDKPSELSQADAVKILEEIKKVPVTGKPTTAEGARDRAKDQRAAAEKKPEAAQAQQPATSGKPVPELTAAERLGKINTLKEACKAKRVGIADVYQQFGVVNHTDMPDADLDKAIEFVNAMEG